MDSHGWVQLTFIWARLGAAEVLLTATGDSDKGVRQSAAEALDAVDADRVEGALVKDRVEGGVRIRQCERVCIRIARVLWNATKLQWTMAEARGTSHVAYMLHVACRMSACRMLHITR